MALNPLRKWLSPDDPVASAPEEPAADDDIPGLRSSLSLLIVRVKSNGGKLPTEAIPEIREAGDQLFELLEFGDTLAASGATIDTYAMFTISAAITDYLPTSIDTYLALPPQFLVSHRNAAVETPAEELVAQVTTLRGGLIELAQSVYAGDSERLSSQRRFLETKFTKSDLDL